MVDRTFVNYFTEEVINKIACYKKQVAQKDKIIKNFVKKHNDKMCFSSDCLDYCVCHYCGDCEVTDAESGFGKWIKCTCGGKYACKKCGFEHGWADVHHRECQFEGCNILGRCPVCIKDSEKGWKDDQRCQLTGRCQY